MTIIKPTQTLLPHIRTSDSWNNNFRLIQSIIDNMRPTDGMLLVLDIDSTIVNSNNRLICSTFGEMLRRFNAKKVHVVILTMRDAVSAEVTLRQLSKELPSFKFSTPNDPSNNFCLGNSDAVPSRMLSIISGRHPVLEPTKWFHDIFAKSRQNDIYVFFSRFKNAWTVHKQIGIKQITRQIMRQCDKKRIITVLVDDMLDNHILHGDSGRDDNYSIVYNQRKRASPNK
jgi:hypothetical protein